MFKLKKIITVYVILTLYSILSCNIRNIENKKTKTEQANLEIQNKSNELVYLSIHYYGRIGQIFGRPVPIEAFNGTTSINTDLTNPIVISISKISDETKRFWIAAPCKKTGTEECEKTIFLTFDGDSLFPQVGTENKTTESGYSLKNNISKDLIFSDLQGFLKFQNEV